jgi:NADH-quinone oxidoreductase subunit E
MIAPVASQPVEESVVDEVIAKHPRTTGDLLGILEELQDSHPDRYLPKVTLRQVAGKMQIATSQIFSVVTFYSFFNLEPQGKHAVMVCRGTACHTRGSRQLLSCVRQCAGMPDDEGGESSFTTPDRSTTVRTVACFGQCALAPVVAIDEDIHGYVTDVRMRELMKSMDTEKAES